MTLTFPKRAILTFAAFATAAAIAACGSDSPTEPSPTPAAVAPATTPPANAQVGTGIAGPSVVVTDPSGAPAAGVIVTFQVTAGGGAIQYPHVATNEQGIASSGVWQIGPKTGANTVTATVEGLGPVTFTLTSQPGPASQLLAVSGQGQRADPGSTLPTPLSARLADAGGNPIAGAAVTFSVLTGGGSLATTTATSSAEGIATSGSWTLGTDPCEREHTARAQTGALQTTFTASTRPALAIPGTADGTLSATDCSVSGAFVDEYNVTTTNGQAVQFSLSSGAFDALLNIVSPGGAPLPADNDAGGGTNPSIRLITAAGAQTVAATSATSGATGPYTVTTAAASADVSTCGTVFVQVGAGTAQTIAESDCDAAGYAADDYLVYVPAGATVRVAQQSPIDAYLFVFSPSGALIAERDAGFLNFTEEATFTAAVAGFYLVRASSWGLVNDDVSPAFDLGPYTLSVTAVSGFGQRSPTDLPTIAAASRQLEQLSGASRTGSPLRGTTRDKK